MSSLQANCLSIQEAHHTDAGYMDKGSGSSRREPAVGHGYMPGMLWRGAFGVCFISFPSFPHVCRAPGLSHESHLIPGIRSKTPVPSYSQLFGAKGCEDVSAGISRASASLANSAQGRSIQGFVRSECWSMCVLEA